MDIDVGLDDLEGLARALIAFPGRLKEALDAKLSEEATDMAARIATAASSAHPQARTPKHRGAWNWHEAVASVDVKETDDGYTVSFGSSRVPGAEGFEYGSSRSPRFGTPDANGRFFTPQAKRTKETLDAMGDEFVAAVGKHLEG